MPYIAACGGIYISYTPSNNSKLQGSPPRAGANRVIPITAWSSRGFGRYQMITNSGQLDSLLNNAS